MRTKPTSRKKHKELRKHQTKAYPINGRINVRSKNKYNPNEEDIKHGLK